MRHVGRKTASAAAIAAMVLVCMGTPTLAAVGAPQHHAGSAIATRAPKAASFVGTYTFHATFSGHTLSLQIRILANGTALDPANHAAHWTAAGSKITITYKTTEKWTGTRTATGINTKAHPGVVTLDGHNGTWYAIKTA